MAEKSRYSILKNLEGIDLHKLKWLRGIDDVVSSAEKGVRKRKFPGKSIHDLFSLVAFKLWQAPSKLVTIDWVLMKLNLVVPQYCKKERRSCISLSAVLQAMMLSSLKEDEKLLKRFATWHKTSALRVFGDAFDMARQHALHQIATLYVTLPEEKIKNLGLLMNDFRAKPLGPIIEAIEFCRSGEQRLFENLLRSVSDHRKRINAKLGKPGFDGSFSDIIAIPESILWNIGCLRGFTPPEVPTELSPFLMTRQNLGLPSMDSPSKTKKTQPVSDGKRIAKAKKTNTPRSKSKARAKKVRRFEFQQGKSNKFWQVSQSGEELVIEFGKIGTDGQKKSKLFASADAAQKQLESLVRQKVNKGNIES